MTVLLVSVQGIRHDMSSYQKLSEIFHIVSSILMVRSKQCIHKIIVLGVTMYYQELSGLYKYKHNKTTITESRFLIDKTECNTGILNRT